MNYPGSVEFLYSLGNEVKTAKLGLDRIGAVLEALGSPHRRGRFVHIAGTNGKGSTAAMIESALRAHGLRTGLFTSPHLAQPTERIRILGEPVSAERFAAAFDQVHAAAEGLLDAGAIDLHPSYFETVAAMAFLIFAEEKLDWVVLEVGLGRGLEAIAGEKAGILKPGVPAVFARQRPEAGQVLAARAAALDCPLARTSDWTVGDLSLDRDGSRFLLAGERELRIRCPLAGEHQVENSTTAAAALVRLGLPEAAIEQGIARARWPGRLERVSEKPEILLDGAHNPAGARALAAYIDRFYARRRVRLIYGAMRDKAVAEIGGILFPRAKEVILTAPRQARAFTPTAMRDFADHPGVRVAADIRAALAMVRDAAPDDAVFVTGSLFLVAEARALLL